MDWFSYILTFALNVFTDAATRAARDLKVAAENKQELVELKMTPSPEGCAENYKMQLSKQSAIVVWCYDSSGNITSSHTTTSHLSHINVPETFIVQKNAGESVFVKLSPEGGKSTVLSVY